MASEQTKALTEHLIALELQLQQPETRRNKALLNQSVSYTHLTLPTIYSV